MGAVQEVFLRRAVLIIITNIPVSSPGGEATKPPGKISKEPVKKLIFTAAI